MSLAVETVKQWISYGPKAYADVHGMMIQMGWLRIKLEQNKSINVAISQLVTCTSVCRPVV